MNKSGSVCEVEKQWRKSYKNSLIRGNIRSSGMKGLAIFILMFICSASYPSSRDDSDAIQYIRNQVKTLGVAESDLKDLSVSSSHYDRTTSLQHFYIQQNFNGYPIEGALANLVRLGNGRFKLINHSLLPDLTKTLTVTSTLSGDQIVQILNRQLIGIQSISGKLTVKNQIWINQEQEWHLTYDVRLDGDQLHWRFWVSASSGEIIRRKDLVLKCVFHASTTDPVCDADIPKNAGAPDLNPGEVYFVYPIPVESPSHGERKLVTDPADDEASPFGWHDVDGLSGAEYSDTRGNNVFAQHDREGHNANEIRPDGGSSQSFVYEIDFSLAPDRFASASVTNLFYWNNINHDVFYHYGFDEPAGNFQINNYGRGGLGNDQIYADAQDGSDRNNAQFFAAEEGLPARMQMYLWNAQQYDSYVTIMQPDGSALQIDAIESGFGVNNKLLAKTIDFSEMVLVRDDNGTTSLGCLGNGISNAEEINGKIALVDRGTCFFIEKVKRLEDLGAVAVVVCNNVAGDAITMGGQDLSITIPAVMISLDQCVILKRLLEQGNIRVEISHRSDPGSLDSALDNLIITHEYGHGITLRLVAGPNNVDCLDNVEQMGEGWSDYFGLMLTTDWSSAKPEDPRGIGTFVSNQNRLGRGIREYPYSFDKTINPMKYEDVKTASITHAVGAIWCAMLWDMTWNIIEQEGTSNDIYRGHGGNNIALRLVVEGLKLLNCSPGFVDGRNAILVADSLLYDGAYQFQIWKAFAARGLGFSADQGSSHSTFDGRSSYELPTTFQTAIQSFIASEQADHINIDIVTKQEYDNATFIIQRSTDKINFSDITNFEGRRIEPNSRFLQFEDFAVMEGQIYYYRLLAQDINHSVQLIAMDSALLIPVDDILVFPNPADGLTSVKIDRTISGMLTLNIYSSAGQIIQTSTLEAERFYTRYHLDLTQVPQGVYILELITDRGRFRKRLVMY